MVRNKGTYPYSDLIKIDLSNAKTYTSQSTLLYHGISKKTKRGKGSKPPSLTDGVSLPNYDEEQIKDLARKYKRYVDEWLTSETVINQNNGGDNAEKE